MEIKQYTSEKQMGQRRSLNWNLKYILNEYENTTNQNLWTASNSVFRGKWIALNAYIRCILSILFKNFKEIEADGVLPNLFSESSHILILKPDEDVIWKEN